MSETCTTHHHACRCREAEFARIEAERDALAELVREVHDGHYDMRSEFVASPYWLARARAAIGEK